MKYFYQPNHKNQLKKSDNKQKRCKKNKHGSRKSETTKFQWVIDFLCD